MALILLVSELNLFVSEVILVPMAIVRDADRLSDFGGWKAIYNNSVGSGDPSINRIFIYKSEQESTYDIGDLGHENFRIYDLETVSEFAIFTAWGSLSSHSDLFPQADMQAFFENVVTHMLSDGDGINSVQQAHEDFYVNQATIEGSFTKPLWDINGYGEVNTPNSPTSVSIPGEDITLTKTDVEALSVEVVLTGPAEHGSQVHTIYIPAGSRPLYQNL